MDWKVWLRIVAALILVAAVAGIAFFAYQAGVAHGSPVTIQAPNGETGPAPYPYFGYGQWHPFWGLGFGCFGPLIALFFVFFALRAIGFIFWGPRWGWGHRHMWRRGWSEGEVPPMFKEMHDRAHGKETPEQKQ